MQIRPIPMEELSELILLQLKNGGRARLTVTGSSMAPMLQHRRDTVELIPVAGPQKKGELILYRRDNGQYVLHRIVKVVKDGYICCGDNQAMREPVRHDQLIAVVDGFIRKGKKYTRKDFDYLLYKAVWVGLFPIRQAHLAAWRALGRLRRSIRRKPKGANINEK